MKYVYRFLLISFILAALVVSLGCSPIQRGIADNAFYSTGQPQLYVQVNGLTPAGGGRFWGDVPSNTNLMPYASVNFAVFGEAEAGPESFINRHAHVMLAEFNEASWRWRMESWPAPSTLQFQSMRAAGKYWTVQIMPVAAVGDWFSGAWQADAKKAPRFWLAKRWSSTPEEYIRIVAEYREPAPQCMQAALPALEQAVLGEQVSPPQGADLLRLCPQEVDAFSARADDAFTFGPLPQTLGTAFARPMPQPDGRPNMKALAGEAEYIDGGSDFGD